VELGDRGRECLRVAHLPHEGEQWLEGLSACRFDRGLVEARGVERPELRGRGVAARRRRRLLEDRAQPRLVLVEDDGEASRVGRLVARDLRLGEPAPARELVEVAARVDGAIERRLVEARGREGRFDDTRSARGGRRGERARRRWRHRLRDRVAAGGDGDGES
jgi:hypothetical protein